VSRLRVAIELLFVEDGSLLEQSRRTGWSSLVVLEVSQALAERQLARQLDKA
jgi:hypothetical protein